MIYTRNLICFLPIAAGKLRNHKSIQNDMQKLSYKMIGEKQ